MVHPVVRRLLVAWLVTVGMTVALGAPSGAQGGPAQGGPAQSAGDPVGGGRHPCVAPGPHGFSDVPSGSYYDVAVGWLLEAAITSGTGPGTFSPNQAVTRAQMAVFLWRSAGSPTPVGSHGFGDVPPGAYFGNAVTWLVGQGITTGTGPGTFSPSQPVTRAQMGVFLWRSSCSSATTAITTGANHSCALKQGDTVACWGSNTFGQLGDGTQSDRLTPSPVHGLSGVDAVAAASQHSCALKHVGTVVCWGNNISGQLGDGTTTSRLTPTFVPGLADVTSISTGISHTCALKQDGSVACWGSNSSGELGDGTFTNSAIPVTVSGLVDISALSGSGSHTCALRQGGTVVCWGSDFGKTPTAVAGASPPS